MAVLPVEELGNLHGYAGLSVDGGLIESETLVGVEDDASVISYFVLIAGEGESVILDVILVLVEHYFSGGGDDVSCQVGAVICGIREVGVFLEFLINYALCLTVHGGVDLDALVVNEVNSLSVIVTVLFLHVLDDLGNCKVSEVAGGVFRRRASGRIYHILDFDLAGLVVLLLSDVSLFEHEVETDLHTSFNSVVIADAVVP